MPRSTFRPARWLPQARTHLGAIYFREGALAKAKLEYERADALALAVEAPPATRKKLYKWLALICKNLGQLTEAHKYEDLAAKS